MWMAAVGGLCRYVAEAVKEEDVKAVKIYKEKVLWGQK